MAPVCTQLIESLWVQWLMGIDSGGLQRAWISCSAAQTVGIWRPSEQTSTKSLGQLRLQPAATQV